MKHNYIKNDVSKCLSPKLIPQDDSTSNINLKVLNSKSKWSTSTVSAWGSSFNEKNCIVRKHLHLFIGVLF